jgi:hypothetical protein
VGGMGERGHLLREFFSFAVSHHASGARRQAGRKVFA